MVKFVSHFRFVWLLGLVLISGSSKASGEPYETIVNHGNSQNRIDVVILGDGYTAAQMQKYRDDALNIVRGMFAEEPFREYQTYFNVHRIDVVSSQSGADHPESSVFVDTAFDASYNCNGIQRMICANGGKISTVVLNTLTLVQSDLILMIVNDPEYGGGSAPTVTSMHPFAIEIMLHELGHTLGTLADEYGGPPPPPCGFSGNANVTTETQRALIKWAKWIDPSTPIPTTTSLPGIPGLYEGAGYCDKGLYRPTFNSKMRSIGVPFEQINSEQLIKSIYLRLSPLESSLPAASSVGLPLGGNQSFSATVPTPFTHSLNVSWSVDGQPVASGLAYTFDGGLHGAGTHSVSVTVLDPTTQVRNDPDQLLTAQRTWLVSVGAAPPVIQLSAANYAQNEGNGAVDILVIRTGDASGPASVSYQSVDDLIGINVSSDCAALSGVALSRCDYLMTSGTLRFAAGETTKTITIPLVDDSYAEGPEHFRFNVSTPGGAALGSPASASVTINDNETVTQPNPMGQAQAFVRQHYIDFLNREPDPAGLQFWTAQITSCGSDPQCIEVKRINVSASFFLSIEFQDTGYFVYRVYKVGHGSIDMPVPLRIPEFLPDTQQIGRGVQVGIGNWQQQLENNKQEYLLQFAQRLRFTLDHPATRTPAEFVDQLLLNANFGAAPDERNSLINEFSRAPNTADLAARVRVLRRIAEHPFVVQQEFNRAFVLMQYFGYLRRNPYDPPEQSRDFAGYNFWLLKLNQFGGNYIDAEMVKAFLTSIEYGRRFGPN